MEGISHDGEGYYSSRRNSKFEEMMKMTFSQGSGRNRSARLNFTIESNDGSSSENLNDSKNQTIDIVDCSRSRADDRAIA